MYADTGLWFNIKMLSYQYRKSHCGDKTVVRSSYLHNGIYYTGKADQKNSLVSGPPTDPATTPPTVNFLQQSEQKVFFMAKKK